MDYQDLCNRSRLTELFQEEVEAMRDDKNTTSLRGGCNERIKWIPCAQSSSCSFHFLISQRNKIDSSKILIAGSNKLKEKKSDCGMKQIVQCSSRHVSFHFFFFSLHWCNRFTENVNSFVAGNYGRWLEGIKNRE
jgi:hypothetical protein